MRTTLEFDGELVVKAIFVTGQDGIAVLVQEALTVLIEPESASRLALLGGTVPNLRRPPRRRPEPPLAG